MPSPPQLWPPVQPPQSIWPPQPSPTMPQYLPFACWHCVGVQRPESSAEPQTLAMPAPPQLCPLEQVPQSIWPPQPSPTTPQYCPYICMHDSGVQRPESG